MHNGDSILHDIEPLNAGGPGWGSIASGVDIDTKVTATGTFTYVCAIGGHTMLGTLIVAP
jgi:plastocyanin